MKDSDKLSHPLMVTASTRVTRKERLRVTRHPGYTLWFTGLSGAGKSSIAVAAEKQLVQQGYNAFVLDGDNVRQHLNRDLNFDLAGRRENIRRVAEVAKLMNAANVIVIAAFIAPYAKDRQSAREIHEQAQLNFSEIHIATSLAECERRDVKGLYAKARSGAIKHFTGISDPFEAPKKPDLRIDTEQSNIESCVKKLLDFFYVEHESSGLDIPI